jgi:hypothetical protein
MAEMARPLLEEDQDDSVDHARSAYSSFILDFIAEPNWLEQASPSARRYGKVVAMRIG